MRVAACDLRVEPDLAQHVGDREAAFLGRADTVRHETLGDDVADRHAWRQGAERVLKDDLDIAAKVLQAARARRGDGRTVDLDAAVVIHQLGDGARQRRFAGTALSDNAERAPGMKFEADPVDRADPVRGAPHQPATYRKVDLNVVCSQQRGALRRLWRSDPFGLGRDQVACVGLPRGGEQAAGIAAFHKLAMAHDKHPVGDLPHNAEIMRDEQHGQALGTFQVGQKVENLRLDGDVERRRRFVGDQHIRAVGKRHRNHHPLALPARQFMRIAGKPRFGTRDADTVQQVEGSRAGRIDAHPLMLAQALADLLFDGVKRVERCHRLLKDHPDLVAAQAPHGRRVVPVDPGAFPVYPAALFGIVGKKAEARQRRDGFPGPALADQRHRLAGGDIKRQAFDRACLAAVATEGNGQVAKREKRRAHEKVFRGSKASRTPSKMKTSRARRNANTRNAVMPSHGAWRFCLA